MKCGNYLSLILSIINTFHFHYVLFFLVTTPCSSPHLLCVLFYAFPQLSHVSFLVLFLDRKAYRKFWINFYNQHISAYILLNVLKEIKIMVIIMGLEGMVFSVLLCQQHVSCK